jgi:two-component system sensor histidine kinase UhpB
VASAQEIVQLGLEDIRRIARELRPEALDDLGLPSALAALTERFSRQARLQIELHVEPDLPELGRDAELVIYRVAQEALTNVARHSGARAAAVRVAEANGRVVLDVHDDGRGFSTDGTARGFGLVGMRERAALAGGTLRVDAAPGNGTRVVADLPVVRR